MLLQIGSDYDFKQLLMGAEDWEFLFETILRTLVMFIVILISLRLLGKRGVKQLSVFELVVIIGLGSAAGDPMFYKDVGLLPALIVFTMIVTLYTFVTYLIGKSKTLEKLIEGKPVCLIKSGVFMIENFKKEAVSEDEFFAELRMQGISQLGQIEEAIVETSGSISIFYYPDEEVKFGLPIMPNSLDAYTQQINDQDIYSCIFCGYTEELKRTTQYRCPTCKKVNWIKSSNKKRIT
jgi:uncharacterized membrane protein YcaP (DUF421 family)